MHAPMLSLVNIETFLSKFGGYHMQFLLAILALSFLIVVHELGHFAAAKLSGIKVHEFSLFMGPKLFGVTKGETLYSVRLVPLGGFVRMEGEEEASDDARAFNKKPLHVRAFVCVAGPAMNVIMAVIIFAIIFFTVGFRTPVVSEVVSGSAAFEAGIQKGDRIVKYGNKPILHPMDISLFTFAGKGAEVEVELVRGNKRLTKSVAPDVIPAQKRYILGFVPTQAEGADSNIVQEIVAGSNAVDSELKPGDRIVALSGKPVSNRQDIGEYMKENNGEPVRVSVLRGHSQIELEVVPTLQQSPEMIDIGVDYENRFGGFFDTVHNAILYTASNIRSVYYGVVWLISGIVSLDQMMGPVGIVTTIGDVVQQSPTISAIILSLLNISAFISVNLGVMNLIPFPALDGSKLLLIAVEGIRRKAIPPEKEAFISMVGFVLLIMLMIFTTYNDILRRVTGG
jgi:regulator of sigma E protease